MDDCFIIEYNEKVGEIRKKFVCLLRKDGWEYF